MKEKIVTTMIKAQRNVRITIFAVLLLAVAGNARGVDYIYNVINNSGNLVLQVKDTGSNTNLNAKMRSPFATSYRYYKTLAEAQADAQYGQAEAGASHGAVAYADNVSISTMGDLTSDSNGKHIYVRYSYNASSTIADTDGNIVKIDGTVAYNMELEGYKGSKKTDLRKCYYYNGLDNSIEWKYSNEVTSDERSSQAFRWYYIGTKAGYEGTQDHPDPYDIKIVNVAGRLADRDYVVCGPQNKDMPFTPSNQQAINCYYYKDGENSKYIYRFFFRAITGSQPTSVQLAAAAPCYIYLKTSNLWFVFNSEEDNNAYKAYLHFRLHNSQEEGTNATNVRAHCMFTKTSSGHRYVIVDESGNERASAYPTDDEALAETTDDRPMVPASIHSPLVGTYTYYTSAAEAMAGTGAKTTITAINDVASDATIYVRYTYDSSNGILKLDGTTPYNMKLDGRYLKYESATTEDSNVSTGSDNESDNAEYMWTFAGSDPYGIVISSKADATKSITGVSTGSTITLGTGSKAAALQAFTSPSTHTPYRYFLVKSPNWTAEKPLYLLRASYIDPEDMLYTWAYGGRDDSDWNEVRPRLFANAEMADTEDYVQMEFDELSNVDITYHIIDKQNEEVTSATTKKVTLSVPDIISSPLVSTYYYHTTAAHATATPQTSDVNSTSGRTDIYVTYDVGTDIDISEVVDNTTAGTDYGKHTDTGKQKYMIRFLDGSYYYQEDGKDGLTDGIHTTRKAGGANSGMGLLNNRYKAEYAYINGDGNFYIYCDSVRNTQFANAANERTRWSWYIDGDNGSGTTDPYHVKIMAASNHSYQTKDDEGVVTATWYGYFFTYYNTTLREVITSTITKDPAVTARSTTDVPTEYMLLGKKGKYRLVTTAAINDGTTTEQRTVNSLEQYFKNYDLIKKNYFDDYYDTPEKLASTDPMTSEQEEELEGRGWHKYEAWANSVQWDGYNTSTGKSKSKRAAYEDHWYQTFEVGELFDLIEVQTDPAIVLLDCHGWEIMRYTMPTTKNADSDKQKALLIKSYDCPLVTYHWYKTGTKRPGRHQYTVDDPAMTEDGSEEYTSTSLLDFPPDYGLNTGDWYVKYEVNDNYKYLYNITTENSAPVLIKQNDRWATAASTTTIGSSASATVDNTNAENITVTGTISDNMVWYLFPNPDIDKEMGYEDPELEYTDDQLRFDPYNIQIKSADNSKFIKTASTATTLSNNQFWSDKDNHPYSVALDDVNDEGEHTATGLDGVTVKVTNATFMAIQDVHGNLRLVPRFDHEGAITNLTGGSPTVDDWIYDCTTANVSYNSSTKKYIISPNETNDATQAVALYPLQQYQFHVRDMEASGSAPDIITSEVVYAAVGTSMLHTLGNVTAALPDTLIRAYCEYPGAYTSYNTSTNEYSNAVTHYPEGSGAGIELIHLYVPFTVNSNASFFDTDEEALASNNWMFLVQGLESVAPIYGQTLYDYGMEVAYGYRTAEQSEDIGVGYDFEGLTPAEKTFVWDGPVRKRDKGSISTGTKNGGFHFLRRTSNNANDVAINSSTGEMTVSATGTDNVSSLSRNARYIASKDTTIYTQMLSPLNDFRRIAETYKENNETGFREGSWLWAFIGNPYKFYVINRETGAAKRLAIINNNLKLTDSYSSYRHFFTMTKYDWQTDEEAEISFAMQVWDGDNNPANDSVVSRNGAKLEGSFNCLSKNATKTHPSGTGPDVAYLKVASFMAYPWNWSDTKYQAVTVNIYPGTEESHGSLVLSKTYTRADRAFIAGDVIDGTDGHFYLPIEAEEDGSWRPDGVTRNTIPYDGHKINIPYELRRKSCKYTVEGGSFTVEQDDSADPTPQVLNIYYTIDTEHAPLFVSESELATFRALSDNGTFNGRKKKDYYYFIDQNQNLTKHLYVNSSNNNGASTAVRFSAIGSSSTIDDPKKLMWYFVGDPYSVRLYNVYCEANSTERNFVRHRYADKTHSTGYSSDASNDDHTFMEAVSSKSFDWEMVDSWIGTTGELNTQHENVSYRSELLKNKPFALRMKVADNDISTATYFYLKDDANTLGYRIYNEGGNSLNPMLNQQNSYPTYPDNRHTANGSSATLVALSPAKVYVTVYDPDEPTRKVTDNEVSDYYAVTDRFKGVPDNLQRKHCEYWWVSTDPDIKSTNMVDEDLYYTVDNITSHIYARYREDSTSPFSRLVDGVPVLKRDASANPWYNMNIGNWWAFFNCSLDGTTYAVNGAGAGSWNNSTLSFVHKGSTLPNSAEKFRKGLQWALIGDPYNFTLRNNRDIIQESDETPGTAAKDNDGNYIYYPAHALYNAINTNATTWTWIRNGVRNTEYFLSESNCRRTEPDPEASSSLLAYPAYSSAAPQAKKVVNELTTLPDGYAIVAQRETKNFTVADGNGNSSITTGDNYATGSNMFLLSVDDADNESFDAIVNVYNKTNELVATTGWTELARSNATWSGSIPTDVMRWGCNYHYWADETMTRYPFRTYDQTDASGKYLIKDGGVVYVNYDYDESLYSSENEYRWVNLFLNWDDEHHEWTNDQIDGETEYKAEYWQYNDATDDFEKRHEYNKTYSYNKWVDHERFIDTQEGWIESPATTAGGFDKNYAYAYKDDGQYADATDAKKQKWAMIGDPYKFILYNYNRKAESGADNSYYLLYNNGTIASNNFTEFDSPKETYPGLYWTWKVDGSQFIFAEGNLEDGTTYGPRTGLPTSFYQDYDGGDYNIETGYLANCNMSARSLYDKNDLVGAVSGYVTFDHKYLITTELTDGTGDNAPLTYHTGTKDKFYQYADDTSYDGDADLDYTNNSVFIISGDPEADPSTEDVTFTEKWLEKYGNGNYDATTHKYTSGTYEGYYVGPASSLSDDPYQEITTYKSVQAYNEESISASTQNLTLNTEANLTTVGDNHIPRFMVMPMAAQARSITFHLKTDRYSDGTASNSARRASDIVFDHTSMNYGVGNTLSLPWMMRRQYCDYKFYLVESSYNTLATRQAEKKIDDLTYTDSNPSNTHRLTSSERSSSTYTSFWTSSTDLKDNADCYNSTQDEYVVPEAWTDKDVYILVTYQPTTEFTDMTSASPSAAKWINIMNTEKGNLLQYTRSNLVTGASKDSLNDVTNDRLWAIEGDPYGFKLHNRYAVHGFTGELNKNWSTVMTTDKVNSTENYNYVDGVDGEGEPRNSNFTYDAETGDPIKKADLTYGASGTADAYGTMSTIATNAVYEAMTGNYSGAMLIHPVNGCINVKNQNGYKYFGAFFFNGAPTGDPVQLNYLQDWDVMRNVYANWKLVKPTAAQLLAYYKKAGFIGGLTPSVATANSALFGKLSAGTQTDDEFNTAWALVHNPDNIVQLTDGYYRLKAYSADNKMVGGHYASGYLFNDEKAAGSTPLHIYGRKGTATNLTTLESYEGNEWMADYANKAGIEVMDVEYDPSSIFKITRVNSSGTATDNGDYIKIETQGLTVSGDSLTSSGTADILFQIQDIGQTAFQLRSKTNADADTETAYLSYNPTTMKYGLNTAANELNVNADGVHDTKWMLEPVGATASNSDGTQHQMPLKQKSTACLYSGATSDKKNFASFYLPYDVLLPEGSTAWIGTTTLNKLDDSMTPWEMQVKTMEEYYDEEGGDLDGLLDDMTNDEKAAMKKRVVPKNTPVLVTSTGEAAPLDLLPADIAISDDTRTAINEATTGFYGEMLSTESDVAVPDGCMIYIFGRHSTNRIAGFYRNAVKNPKTNSASGRYIQHNKIYYVGVKKGAETKQQGFLFNFLETASEDEPTVIDDILREDPAALTDDGPLYDLHGRLIAKSCRKALRDGLLKSGVYVVSGRKFVVK